MSDHLSSSTQPVSDSRLSDDGRVLSVWQRRAQWRSRHFDPDLTGQPFEL